MDRRLAWRLGFWMIPLAAALPGACAPSARRQALIATAQVRAATRAATEPATTQSLAASPASQPDDTSQPTSEPSTTQSSTQPATRPARPSVPPPPPPALTSLKEGTYLADRVGRFRFNPMGPYPHFDFWEKGQRVEIDLLPNRALAAMEQAAFWDDRLRFRVWGEVTSYNGKDYLLVERVTKVLPTTTSRPDTTAPTSQPAVTQPAVSG